jgi:hypothetical protein
MSKSNERAPQITSVFLGSGASASTVVFNGLFFRKKSRIKNVWIVDQAGITVSASNYETLTLQDNSSSPVAYAAIATSAVAAVANTQLAMVLSSPTDADTNHLEKEVPAGTMLNLQAIGTGTAKLTNASLMIEWYPL